MAAQGSHMALRAAGWTQPHPQMVGAGKTQGPEELWKRIEQQEAQPGQARLPGESPSRGTEKADVFPRMASAAPGHRESCTSSAEREGQGSVLEAGGRAPVFQMQYLESLASVASFEDDVGRGPPLLCSLALASDASAGARKGGGWLGEGGTRGQGQAREGSRSPPRHSLSQTTSPSPPALTPPEPPVPSLLHGGPLSFLLRRSQDSPHTPFLPNSNRPPRRPLWGLPSHLPKVTLESGAH